MGGERAPNAGQGPGSGALLVEPRGQEVGGADCLWAAARAEPNVHCEGQYRYSAADPAAGHGHKQRRCMDSMRRLRRLLQCRLFYTQFQLLQASPLLRCSVQAGTQL